jgi:DnaJ family protein C protein 7
MSLITKNAYYSSILTQSPSWIEASALRAHLIYLLDKQPANQILTHLSKNLAMDPDCKSLKTLLKSLKRLEAIKSEGNEAFGQREWDKALEKYSEFLETSGADGIPRVKVLSNRANVYSKVILHSIDVLK